MLPRPRLNYPRRNLAELLSDTAWLRPERTALVCDGEIVSYRELDALANAAGKALGDAGVGFGDRVVLSLENSIEWAIAYFAVLRHGAAVVAANPRWTAPELAHAVGLTRPRLIIGDRTSAAAVRSAAVPALLVEGPGRGTFWDGLRAHDGTPAPSPEADWPEREATLLFSSGTTGTPKAVRHGHGSLTAAVLNWKSAVRLGDDDRQQMVLPLFTVLGVSTLVGAVAAGAPLYLARRFDLEAMLAEIERERITLSPVVAPLARQMAGHPRLEEYDLSSVRCLAWVATGADPAVAETVTRRSGVRWLLGYGTTELPGLHCNPVEYPERCRLDSPGVPRSDTEVRIIDPDTLADVPPGEVGEVVARGPALMLGYLPEEATAEVTLPGGWFRTGDLARADEDGWLVIVDRIKDLIKVSGLQVAPAEVEAALLRHDGVADCGVFGIPDERRGEVPAAAIVEAPGGCPDDAALLAWLAGRLSTYKLPARILRVREIPRTASGKTLRRRLRDLPEAAYEGRR
jgi:acyl-CoA synthetase (AMP-forming)/AMP-acid ligase II